MESKSQIEMRDDDDEQEALDELVQPNANTTSGGKQVEEMKTELSVDEVLEGHVGSFGLAQVLQVLLVSLAWIFDSQNTLVSIFTDAQPATWRCLTPEQYGSAVPIPSDLCGGPASKRDAASVCGLPEGAWEWIGGHKSSIIAEWGLVCDHKFLAAVPASLFFLGSLLGSALYGKLADSILGRKRTVVLSCILCSVTAFATSFSPNIWTYALLRFSNGFARSGIGICCLVLSTEAVGRRWRGQVGQYGFFFFTVGFLSLPLLAYPTRSNWRSLYKIISALPIAYTFLLVPLVSESPRWLLLKGRDRDALDVLHKLARINGKRLPASLKLSNPSAPIQGDERKNDKLWTTKWAAKRMILVMIAGFGVGFVYYGIQLNAENLNFNLYFSVALNAVMEIPAVFLGSVMLSYMNRRIIFSLSAAVAGAASMLCIIFARGGEHASKDNKAGGSWPQLTIEAAGFMAASTAFDVLYIYCVELFPTNVRNFAVSQLRQALMLGASLAPMLVVLGRMSPAISFLVFGVLSICSGVLSLWLPETRNAPLYETLKQQEEEEKVSRRTAQSRLEPGIAK